MSAWGGGAGGGCEGWREIIASWCVCVAGGSGIVKQGVGGWGGGVWGGVGGIMSLPAGVSVVGAHLDLDWLCEERAERPAHVYAWILKHAAAVAEMAKSSVKETERKIHQRTFGNTHAFLRRSSVMAAFCYLMHFVRVCSICLCIKKSADYTGICCIRFNASKYFCFSF